MLMLRRHPGHSSSLGDAKRESYAQYTHTSSAWFTAALPKLRMTATSTGLQSSSVSDRTLETCKWRKRNNGLRQAELLEAKFKGGSHGHEASRYLSPQ